MEKAHIGAETAGSPLLPPGAVHPVYEPRSVCFSQEDCYMQAESEVTDGVKLGTCEHSILVKILVNGFLVQLLLHGQHSVPAWT